MPAAATVAPLSVPSPHSASDSRSRNNIASPSAVTPDMRESSGEEGAMQQQAVPDEPADTSAVPPSNGAVSSLPPSAAHDTAEMDAAATKIQAMQRGRMVRQASQAKPAAEPDAASPTSVTTPPATDNDSSAPLTSQSPSTSEPLPVWRAIILVQRRFRRLKEEAQRKLRQMLLRQRLLEEKRVQDKLARASKGRRGKQHELMGAGELVQPKPAVLEQNRPTTLQAPPRGPLTPQLSPLSPVSPKFLSLPNSPLMQGKAGPSFALEGLPPLSRNSSLGVTARSLRSPGRIAGKAADLLFGGAKANADKRLDKLGVSAAELSLFDSNPRAFNKLGVSSKHEQQHRPPNSGSVELEMESGVLRDGHARKNSQTMEAYAAGEQAKESAEREEREQKERQAKAEKERIARERQEEEERARQREAELAARPTEASSLTGKAAQLLLGINKADRRGSLEGGRRRTSVSVPSRPLSANSPDNAEGASEQSIVAHSHKVLDKLGVTSKQLEMFPVAQSRAFLKLGVDQPHRPSDSTEASAHHASHAQADAEAMRLSQAAAEAARLEAQAAAHAPKKQSSKKVSALVHGGANKQTKVLDKLGMSSKEMQLLRENPVAFKKLGLFHEEKLGSGRSPASASLLPPSVLLHPPQEAEPYVDPASVRPASNAALGKAQGLLGGVTKKQGPGVKEQTQLGISKKERDIFADKQKAYQQLGVFEQQALRKAMLQAAEDYKASDRQAQAAPTSLAPIPGQRHASTLSSSHSTPYLPSHQQQHASAALATANAPRMGARLAPLSRMPTGATTTPSNSKWGRMKGQLATRTAAPSGSRTAVGGTMSYSQSLAALPSLNSSNLSAYRNTGLFSVVLAAKRHSALNSSSPGGSPQRPRQAPSIASKSTPAVGDASSLGVSGMAMQLNASNPGTPVRSPARSRAHSRNPSRSQLIVDAVRRGSPSPGHSRSQSRSMQAPHGMFDRSPSQSASPAPPEDSQYSTWNSTSQSLSAASSSLSVPTGSTQRHSLSPLKSSLTPLTTSPSSSTSPLNPRSPLSAAQPAPALLAPSPKSLATHTVGQMLAQAN